MRLQPWNAAALVLTVIVGAAAGALAGAHLGRASATKLAPAAATATCLGSCGRPGPVVFAAGSYSGTKPSDIQFSGDAGDIVSGIKWASWDSQAAAGSGTIGIDNCTPNCAEGAFTYVPAAITLSDPAAEGTSLVWTSMTESYDGRTLVFSSPGMWAQGAS